MKRKVGGVPNQRHELPGVRIELAVEGIAKQIDLIRHLKELHVWKVGEAIREVHGKPVYHFFGVNGPVDIAITESKGSHGRGIHRTISVADATFIAEQTRIKNEHYMTLGQIRERIAEAVGEDASDLLTRRAMESKITRRTVRVNSRQIEVITFGYPSISRRGEIVRIKLRVDGNQYIVAKRDAELIIRDEIAKRRDYVNVCDVATACGVERSTVESWCRARGIQYYGLRGVHALMPKGDAERIIAEKPAAEIPPDAQKLAPLLSEYGVEDSTFRSGLVNESGISWFTYDAIEDGMLVARRLQIYKSSGDDWYIRDGDQKIFEKDRAEERRRWRTDELAEQVEVDVVTLNGRKKERPGFFWVRVGDEKLYLPYVVVRKKAMIDPDELIRRTWPTVAEAERILGIFGGRVDTKTVENMTVYTAVLEDGRRVELPHREIDKETRLSNRAWQEAMALENAEVAENLFAEFGVTARLTVDGNHYNYQAIENGQVVTRRIDAYRDEHGVYYVPNRARDLLRRDSEERAWWVDAETINRRLGFTIASCELRGGYRVVPFERGQNVPLPEVTIDGVRLFDRRVLQYAAALEMKRIETELSDFDLARYRTEQDGRGVYRIPLDDGSTVELPEISNGTTTRIVKDGLVRARWFGLDMAAEIMRIKVDTLSRYRVPKSWEFRIPKTEIALPYTINENGEILIDMRMWITARWSTVEQAAEMMGVPTDSFHRTGETYQIDGVQITLTSRFARGAARIHMTPWVMAETYSEAEAIAEIGIGSRSFTRKRDEDRYVVRKNGEAAEVSFFRFEGEPRIRKDELAKAKARLDEDHKPREEDRRVFADDVEQILWPGRKGGWLRAMINSGEPPHPIKVATKSGQIVELRYSIMHGFVVFDPREIAAIKKTLNGK